MWIIVVVLIVIAAVILVVVLVSKKTNESSRCSNYEEKKTEQRELSYKQQMYMNSLKGDESSPYSVANYIISQSAYDAFSDFVQEVFGYEKGSKESDRKIYLMIRKGWGGSETFIVHPDGDKDITFPRTSTKFLDRSHDFAMREFVTLDSNNMMFFFNDSGSTLSKLIKLYFEKQNVEYKYISRIKPFPAKTNCCAVLDKNSEEIAMVYFLIRKYSDSRPTIGLKRHNLPSQKTFNQFRTKAMEKYRLSNEYEFMRYLISYFVPSDLIAKVFFGQDMPKVQIVRDALNYNPGYDKTVLKHYRSIEKELLNVIK